MDRVFTPPTNIHGRKPDSNFTPPPLDGSLTVPEIYDFHYKYNPHHHVFAYAQRHGGIKYLNFSHVVPAADRAARYVASIAKIDLDADSSTYPSIAILATSDTITSFTTVLGLLRAGVTTVPISPRNSAPAVAHLLHKTSPSNLLISVETTIGDLANNAIKQFIESYPREAPPKLSLMPEFDDLYVIDDQYLPLRPRKRDWDYPCLIPHSSGSTSFPKPIVCTNWYLLQSTFSLQEYSTHDMCGEIVGCHAIAMYHAIGLNFIPWHACSGLIMATFEPTSPAKIPTPDSTICGFLQVPVSYIFVMPSFLEEWSKDVGKVNFLKQLKGISFGGSSLNQAIGDSLAKEGVYLYPSYGLTEVGVINSIMPDPRGMDWEYFVINPRCAAEFAPRGDGTYELIIIKKPSQALAFINTKFRNQDAYATSDIFVPHPTKSGQWKIIGRTDDQIMLSNGEKTNPGPLESILRQDRHISRAIMFGRGRFQNGVIIEPNAEYALDPSDEKKLVDFRNEIWPTVEKVNAFAPTHSRLFKEMILVTSPTKPFSLTSKGSLRRAAILQDYEVEIEALYDSLDKINIFEPPTDWSESASLSFISTVVRNIVDNSIGEADDIFKFGCDSLQAMWIRNAVLYALRNTSPASVAKISSNLVYEYPNIVSLAQYASRIAEAAPDAVNECESKREPEELEIILSRHIKSFPKHVSSLPAAEKDVVLITGTTGALGSAVLAKLVPLESVGKIFAYNRPSHGKVEILTRQKEALKIRGYDEEIAISPKVILVEGELTTTGLGIDHALEEEIRKTVTHIFHTAWKVDFNLRVSSFESGIGGVRTLVDLALSSPQPIPPRLLFTSSVGVLRNTDLQVPFAEVPIVNPYVPLGQGYGESKWVAERILYEANKQTSLRSVVVRIGQISGGINGAWNPSEWVGSMTKSSVAIGSFPELRGTCSWIPLDLAACAMVEMRNTGSFIVNLAHPYPVPSSELVQVITQTLSLPLMPYFEWEKKLEEVAASVMDGSSSARSAELMKRVPAIALIDFFKNRINKDSVEAMGTATLRVEVALKESITLRNARRIGADDVRSWLNYWKETGFLQ